MGLFGVYGVIWDIWVSLGLYEGIWGCVGVYGVIWDIWVSLGLYGGIWACMGTYGVIWVSMGLYGGCMELYGVPCTGDDSIEFCGAL